MLKKSYTIFLLLLCSIPLLFSAFFHIQQKSIQRRMKDRLEEQSLHQVSISENDIHWIKKGKEILLDGKMFDIKSINIKNGVCQITGLFDEEETYLVKQLEKQQEPTTTSGKKLVVQFIQIFQSTLSDLYSNSLLQSTLTSKSAERDWQLATGSVSVLTPPPQIGSRI